MLFAPASIIGRIICRIRTTKLTRSSSTWLSTRFSQTRSLKNLIYLHLHHSRSVYCSTIFNSSQAHGKRWQCVRFVSFLPQHPGYKDLNIVVTSNRVASIANQALSLGSAKTKEAFYNGNMRLNGKKLVKKTTKVSVGDTIDIILEVYDDKLVLKRVLVLSDGEETVKGKFRYHVRRWKLMELPRVLS